MSFKKLVSLFTCALLFVSAVAQTELTDEEEQEALVLRIREHVLAGNAFELQTILSNVTNITTVARGMRYDPADAALFTRKTENRDGDPDVVSLRGFADSILFGNGDPDALAKVFTAVLYIQGPSYAPDPATTFKNLFESFSDPEAMQAILDSEPSIDDGLPLPPEAAPGRRLLVKKGTPADTPLCNSCFEKKFCKKNAPWC